MCVLPSLDPTTWWSLLAVCPLEGGVRDDTLTEHFIQSPTEQSPRVFRPTSRIKLDSTGGRKIQSMAWKSIGLSREVWAEKQAGVDSNE